ncbi:MULTISPECIES: hypothetical protein [unclassified Diaminobutyricimonas]|uniref:hypothetical protein n=1 Tax=unclassified Diaminobutyricimonas TaxID=2643261 RepID=UPI0012F4DBD8|nr:MULTISPECIES: hypothetical protein [unclassified Diaminobutyricimonas]
MNHSPRVAAIALALGVALGMSGCALPAAPLETSAPVAAHDPNDHAAAPARGLIDQDVFHQDMRKLWEDHITWTRLYIVSAIADLPDLEATAGRLLQNQADIGDAVTVFYGDEAGAALTELLREHILGAADLLAAAKAGDAAAVKIQSDRWYQNADDISRFLADANPNWPFGVLKKMMRGHLDQTLDEATARLTGDWAADVAAYDEIHHHILMMADALADGIIKQFPKRFTD